MRKEERVRVYKDRKKERKLWVWMVLAGDEGI